MNGTAASTVAGILVNVLKDLEKRLEEVKIRERIETELTTAYGPEKICRHSNSSERPPSNDGVKNLQGGK